MSIDEQIEHSSEIDKEFLEHTYERSKQKKRQQNRTIEKFMQVCGSYTNHRSHVCEFCE